MPNQYLTLLRRDNQARGIAQYTIDFLAGRLGDPSDAVYQRTEQFHLDSIACAVAALAEGMKAPCLLRDEALLYRPANPADGVPCFATTTPVMISACATGSPSRAARQRNDSIVSSVPSLGVSPS